MHVPRKRRLRQPLGRFAEEDSDGPNEKPQPGRRPARQERRSTTTVVPELDLGVLDPPCPIYKCLLIPFPKTAFACLRSIQYHVRIVKRRKLYHAPCGIF